MNVWIRSVWMNRSLMNDDNSHIDEWKKEIQTG